MSGQYATDQSAYYGTADQSYADTAYGDQSYQYGAEPQSYAANYSADYSAGPTSYAADYSADYSAAPTTYSAEYSAAPTTYSADYTAAATTYSADYYSYPASASANAVAYPSANYPPPAGGVPYPAGYTPSNDYAVPYPSGYTPSASSSAHVPRTNTDEDKKAAALAALPVMPAGTGIDAKGRRKKAPLRAAGGEAWEDPTLTEWDPNDFRLFCGDLGNEVTDDLLFKAFSKYPSVLKARVVRDKRTNKSRGYGFVSFKDPSDFVKALKEMNGKYIGNRPIKLRKSTWQERTVTVKTLKKMQETAIFKPVIKTAIKK